MTRGAFVGGVLALFSVIPALLAQPVPLPTVLLTAKTIAVENGGVDQEEYEWVVQDVRGWQRFTFVDDRTKADVTVIITGERVTKSPLGDGQGRYNGLLFRLSFKRGDTLLYSDTLKGCCTFRAMLRGTLERLDKRLQAESRRQK